MSYVLISNQAKKEKEKKKRKEKITLVQLGFEPGTLALQGK